jgi:hypothetical protein
MNAESLKPSSKSVPEAREETAHPAGPIPASLRFESDTLSFKLGEQRPDRRGFLRLRRNPGEVEKQISFHPETPSPLAGEGGGEGVNSNFFTPSPIEGEGKIGFPDENKLAKKTIIESMAEELFKLAWSPD